MLLMLVAACRAAPCKTNHVVLGLHFDDDDDDDGDGVGGNAGTEAEERRRKNFGGREYPGSIHFPLVLAVIRS